VCYFKGCVAVESLAVSLCQLKFLTLSRLFWATCVSVPAQVRLDLCTIYPPRGSTGLHRVCAHRLISALCLCSSIAILVVIFNRDELAHETESLTSVLSLEDLPIADSGKVSALQLAMCQLLGMSCNVATDFSFQFKGFKERGGNTSCNSDGWGVAFYQGEGQGKKNEKGTREITLLCMQCCSILHTLLCNHMDK
jgi:Glutamine amidotransferases class-II